ncbi:Ubiquitin--protein ligase [Bertholletia excelsa]
MAMEHYLQEALPQDDSIKSASTRGDGSEENPSCGFECNICLDFVQEPVVTLCGHLYCWPCIYKWIHFQTFSAGSLNQPQCPVCKAEVSQRTLVPLYGRGQTANPSKDKSPNLGIAVPRRPPSPRCRVHSLTSSTPHPAQQYYQNTYFQSHPYPPQPAMPMLGLGGTIGTDVFPPMVGMFRAMVYSRMFGNSETTLYNTYPYSYHLAGSNSPRVRRHMMKVDESLSRICFFLCCCVVLCLLLF